MNFERVTYGKREAELLLIQFVDDQDLELLDKEMAYLHDLSDGKDVCLEAVKVKHWNRDLSPWPAPAVFGREDFEGRAPETLEYLEKEILAGPAAEGKKRIYIGGYSLAGLFALWAGCQSDRFHGIAAASPSIWFPGFTEYMKDHPIHAKKVYLSLGDREERTRNPVMARVGKAIREGHDLLKEQGVTCILEWNKGNHFKDSDLRTARAFAWLLSQEDSEGDI